MADSIQGVNDLVTASKQISIAIGLLNQTLTRVFPNALTTATTATGGAATLPANPVGFINVVDPASGNTVKIPFYAI